MDIPSCSVPSYTHDIHAKRLAFFSRDGGCIAQLLSFHTDAILSPDDAYQYNTNLNRKM